jgi:hypothetical protein
MERTMWSRNLAPDHPDLGSPNLLLAPVDVRNLLAEVEAAATLASRRSGDALVNSLGGVGVLDALNLDQAARPVSPMPSPHNLDLYEPGARVRRLLCPLVANVLAPTLPLALALAVLLHRCVKGGCARNRVVRGACRLGFEVGGKSYLTYTI